METSKQTVLLIEDRKETSDAYKSLNRQPQATSGLTLVEVMFSLIVMVLVFQGVVMAYMQSSRRAEWSGNSLAAGALGVQVIEQARAGIWDMSINKNELTNLNLTAWTYNTSALTGSGYSWAILDLPVSGTNTVMATNYVTIKTVFLNGQTNPPVQVQLVSVDTVWPFSYRSGTRYYTNHNYTYCAPDNRDASSL